MKCSAWLLGLFALLAIAPLPISSAQAQAERTWVSATGNDSNACSRTLPCRTLAIAFAKTAVNGEINCLDPISSTTLTITSSITIDCAGTFGSFDSSAQPFAMAINAPVNTRVILRNLTFNGYGSSTAGIAFNGGTVLELDNVKFEGFTEAGVYVDRNSFGALTIRNSSFSEMKTGIKLSTITGNIVASVSDTSFNNLIAHGVEANANVFVAVNNSVFTALGGTAILATTATSTVYAEHNLVTNSHVGISANVAGARITASRNALYSNSKAFNVAAGATLLSAGDNKFDINPGNPATGTLGTK